MTISEKKRKQLLLLAMISSTSLIFLNATLFPVALPTIQKELNVTVSGLQWIINAYLLATAVFVIATLPILSTYFAATTALFSTLAKQEGSYGNVLLNTEGPSPKGREAVHS